MTRSAVVSLAVFMAALTFGQTNGDPRFDVATVKPSGPEEIQAGTSGMATGHGRATGTNVTLKRCIIGSYHIGPNQLVGGPSWVDSDRFHIEAKAAEPTNDDATLDAMMRTLLTERFHLVMHRETRTLPVLALEVGKNGPKLEKASGGEAMTDSGYGRLTVKNTTMDSFAERLSRQADLPVVNRTGINGIFNLKLRWTPDDGNPNKPDAPPSLFTAIQEQLGLRLQSQKAPIEVFVIDRAEKPSEN